MEKQDETNSGIRSEQERRAEEKSMYIHLPENIAKLQQHYGDKDTVILVFDPNERDLLKGMELVPTLPDGKRRTFSYTQFCLTTKKSEQQFIDTLKAAYPGKKLVVVIGDGNDGGRTAKLQLSSKTTGFRDMFKRFHIPCFLVDDFRTSSLWIP
ncbi:hypothetical protein HDU88_003980 [Geranomyces variabilis]|nr:hypothetical protein HDU88_003980 [Geranomyces variabilis]